MRNNAARGQGMTDAKQNDGAEVSRPLSPRAGIPDHFFKSDCLRANQAAGAAAGISLINRPHSRS